MKLLLKKSIWVGVDLRIQFYVLSLFQATEHCEQSVNSFSSQLSIVFAHAA